VPIQAYFTDIPVYRTSALTL